MTFGIVLGRLSIPTRDQRVHQLRARLSQQLVDSDLNGASRSFDKLCLLAPENQNFTFQQATVEHARGNNVTANELISSLIEHGNASAACWVLEQEFKDQNYSKWDETKHKRFEKLVSLASKSADPPTAKRSKEHLAAYQLAHNQLEESLETLHEVSRTDPAAALNAALVAIQIGQNDRARGYLTKAQVHFENEILQNPKDQRSRLQLSRSFILQAREEEALRRLSEGFKLTGDSCFQQAAGEAMIMWASRIKQESNSSSEAIFRRVKLIHRATQCAPSDLAVLKALASILNELRYDPEHNATQLQAAMANGFDHESSHFMLGILSLLKGSDNEAHFHCDLAEASGSHIATVLNNLALLALEHEEIASQDALLLVNGAIRRLAGQPQFRETRGRILIALGRYAEAIDDLKEALVIEALKPNIHKNLSVAYAALGDSSAAAHYKNCAASHPQ